MGAVDGATAYAVFHNGEFVILHTQSTKAQPMNTPYARPTSAEDSARRQAPLTHQV